jgi:hypothetical protein
MERGRVVRVPLVGCDLVPHISRRILAASVAPVDALVVAYAVRTDSLDESGSVHVPVIVIR